jgi:hypothetical protein
MYGFHWYSIGWQMTRERVRAESQVKTMSPATTYDAFLYGLDEKMRIYKHRIPSLVAATAAVLMNSVAF